MCPSDSSSAIIILQIKMIEMPLGRSSMDYAIVLSISSIAGLKDRIFNNDKEGQKGFAHYMSYMCANNSEPEALYVRSIRKRGLSSIYNDIGDVYTVKNWIMRAQFLA